MYPANFLTTVLEKNLSTGKKAMTVKVQQLQCTQFIISGAKSV
jgi:hypothetical protein